MKTEYEATFLNIHKGDLIEKIKVLGGNLVHSEYLQKRVTLNLPEGKRNPNTWLRVRCEANNKITLALKSIQSGVISGQKELLVEVSNFDDTVELLEIIGCERKSYQESKREMWQLGDIEVAIDTWPFLDTYVELEGPSESSVKEVASILGLDYRDAIFDTVNKIYRKKYGKGLEELDEEILKNFTFAIENPFV